MIAHSASLGSKRDIEAVWSRDEVVPFLVVRLILSA
jgi:hypothetical protein